MTEIRPTSQEVDLLETFGNPQPGKILTHRSHRRNQVRVGDTTNTINRGNRPAGIRPGNQTEEHVMTKTRPPKRFRTVLEDIEEEVILLRDEFKSLSDVLERVRDELQYLNQNGVKLNQQ